MSGGSRTMKVVLPVGLVVVAALLAAGMVALKPDVETRVAAPKPRLVRAAEVTLTDVPLIVRSQGTVRPRTESQLVPEVSGRVIWVSPSFAEGEFFEKGEVLLKVDPHDSTRRADQLGEGYRVRCRATADIQNATSRVRQHARLPPAPAPQGEEGRDRVVDGREPPIQALHLPGRLSNCGHSLGTHLFRYAWGRMPDLRQVP